MHESPFLCQTLACLSAARRLLHHSPPWIHFSSSKRSFRSLLNNAAPLPDSSTSLALGSFRSPSSSPSLQVRHVSSREKVRRRKPMTPRTSKLKKIKLSWIRSYRDRFRTMSDGKIRRWREGKNHNAHLKLRKSGRRLRQPAIVLAANVKVMKKLNFCS